MMVSSLQGGKPTRTEALKSYQTWSQEFGDSILPTNPNQNYLVTKMEALYQFNKLLFEISCAPELFQRRTNRILAGLEGVVCLIDDVLVFTLNRVKQEQYRIPWSYHRRATNTPILHISFFCGSRTKDTLKFPFERWQHTCITMAMSFVAT